MIHGALGSRYAIGGALGRSVKRAAAGGWWLSGGIAAANCIAAYQPKGAADIAGSYVNLASPGTYNATPGTAPDWDSTNGWKFNGSSHYLICPIPYFIPKNYSMIIRFSNAKQDGSCCLAGITEVANNQFNLFACNSAATNVVYQIGDKSVAGSAKIASGVLAIANDTGYKNGTADATISNTENSPTTIYFYIGARNLSGTLQGLGAKYIQAMAVYNISIASYIAALTTAMNAL